MQARRINAPEALRSVDAPVAAACILRLGETAMRKHERGDGGTRSAKPFPERGGGDFEDFRRLVVIQLHDLAEYVCHSVISIQAKQHGERAADAHLFEEELALRVWLL